MLYRPPSIPLSNTTEKPLPFLRATQRFVICAQLALKCVKNKSASWERKTMSQLCFVRRLSGVNRLILCAEIAMAGSNRTGWQKREGKTNSMCCEWGQPAWRGWVSMWFHSVSALGQWSIVCSTLPSHTNMTSLLWHTGCDFGYSFLFETFAPPVWPEQSCLCEALHSFTL